MLSLHMLRECYCKSFHTKTVYFSCDLGILVLSQYKRQMVSELESMDWHYTNNNTVSLKKKYKNSIIIYASCASPFKSSMSG